MAEYQMVTGRQTDRQIDGQTPTANTALMHSISK